MIGKLIKFIPWFAGEITLELADNVFDEIFAFPLEEEIMEPSYGGWSCRCTTATIGARQDLIFDVREMF